MVTVGHNAKRIGAEVLADMLAGYGVTHVFMVPAVLRRTFAEMERRRKSRACIATARNPLPTWPMAMRARPANPASAWRK